jgi:hypothetical protein
VNPQTELLANIPAELRAPPLWLQYYLKSDPKHPDKKPGKCPCMKYGTPEDRANNLRSLDHLLTRPKQAGFQRWVSKNEGFVFVDLDHVRNVNTGEVEPWAEQLIEQLDSYTEISASGTGFHIVCKGTLPEDVEPSPDSKVEIYSGASRPNKLIAMTGDVIDVFHKTIEHRQEQLDQLLKSVKSKSEPTAAPAEALDWKSRFHTVDELKDGDIAWLIENILPEGVAFIGALSGAGKTWFCLSMARALTTGKKFLGNHSVITPVDVLYLCPEMSEKTFKKRCRLFGISDRFRCQTISDGVPINLADTYLKAAVSELKPVVFLDTAIRFSNIEDENSAGEFSQGMAKAIFALMHMGARAVICLHHRAKAGAEAEELTLENTLRGSGDIGAICDVVWGLQYEKGSGGPYAKESRKLVRLAVRCVKARDFSQPEDFRIQLSPFIENIGDFGVLTGDAMSTELEGRKSEAERLSDAIAANPKATFRELGGSTGIAIARIKKVAAEGDWHQDDGLWKQSEPVQVVCSVQTPLIGEGL